MPEQEHEYHPAVEDVMETSGPDIGRIKDINVARKVAGDENFLRDTYPLGMNVDENVAKAVEESTRREIGKKAGEDAQNAVLSYDQLHENAEKARAVEKDNDSSQN